MVRLPGSPRRTLLRRVSANIGTESVKQGTSDSLLAKKKVAGSNPVFRSNSQFQVQHHTLTENRAPDRSVYSAPRAANCTTGKGLSLSHATHIRRPSGADLVSFNALACCLRARCWPPTSRRGPCRAVSRAYTNGPSTPEERVGPDDRSLPARRSRNSILRSDRAGRKLLAVARASGQQRICGVEDGHRLRTVHHLV
jgi:hypothetical protein